MFNILSLSILSSLFLGAPSVVLNSQNTLLIKGPIDEFLVAEFIHDLNKRETKDNLYLFLDTPGGSVEDGTKIINEVIKYKIDCIAERAYSMGFVIFQSCNKRYITKFGRLMQHQISFGINNEKAKVENYVDFVDQIEKELLEMQTEKIGISSDYFKKKTFNDWWLVGKKAIEENCADEILFPKCSIELTKKSYKKKTMFGTFVFSSCPLVSGYLSHIKHNESENPFMPFYTIEKEIYNF